MMSQMNMESCSSSLPVDEIFASLDEQLSDNEDKCIPEGDEDDNFVGIGSSISSSYEQNDHQRADNTWEPEDNLACPELIREFEKQLKKKEEKKNNPKKKLNRNDGDVKKTKIKRYRKEPWGFHRGLEAEKILGATDYTGELMFLIKWKDSDISDLVPAHIANIRCPQVVINYYETRLVWNMKLNEDLEKMEIIK